jgi:formamidopyrimidine-DNA glycosylase
VYDWEVDVMTHKWNPKKALASLKKVPGTMVCDALLDQLRKHWLIYKKKKCTKCEIPVITKHTGKGKRYNFFCENCHKPT